MGSKVIDALLSDPLIGLLRLSVKLTSLMEMDLRLAALAVDSYHFTVRLPIDPTKNGALMSPVSESWL